MQMDSRQAVLPAALCAALALAAPHVRAAATHMVINCADAGSGSLRAAVAAAASGDTVHFDLATMQCSSISLSTGSISTSLDDLAISGPGSALLEVHGHAFLHTGNGTLTISGLKMSSGFTYEPGPCVKGHNVTLRDDVFDDCQSYTGMHLAGAVYAIGDLRVSRTTFVSNRIFFSSALSGAAAYVVGNAYVDGSTFDSNAGGNGALAVGGKNVVITGSTFSGNNNFEAALVVADSSIKIANSTFSANWGSLRTRNAGATTAIYNTTFSGNAGFVCAGIYTSGLLLLANSTVASNTASTDSYNGHTLAAGVCSGTTFLLSSIIANNTIYGSPSTSADITGSLIIGSNNLVMTPFDGTVVPADTISADPLLAPLADNGGPTLTQALMAGSPARWAGSNPFRFASDQRGLGYARMTGEHTDIGAVQSGDGIFSNGYE
jgi:hypothetical protein